MLLVLADSQYESTADRLIESNLLVARCGMLVTASLKHCKTGD